MKNQLETLFGSQIRWRIIKFFILNDKKEYTASEVINRNKIPAKSAGPVLKNLVSCQFLSSRNRNKKNFYILNKEFPFVSELKNLVIRSNVHPQFTSLEKIKTLGDVKLGLVSGVFLNQTKVKTDLLIVVDNLSRAKLRHLLEELEAEMGREVNYSIMTFSEFKYRVDMFDKFIMELFESPHEIVVNKVPQMLREIKRTR